MRQGRDLAVSRKTEDIFLIRGKLKEDRQTAEEMLDLKEESHLQRKYDLHHHDCSQQSHRS